MNLRSRKDNSTRKGWAGTKETFKQLTHKVGHMCQGVYVQCSCGHDRFLKIYSNVMSINVSQMLYQICLSCLCIHELKSKGYYQAKQKISSIKTI